MRLEAEASSVDSRSVVRRPRAPADGMALPLLEKRPRVRDDPDLSGALRAGLCLLPATPWGLIEMQQGSATRHVVMYGGDDSVRDSASPPRGKTECGPWAHFVDSKKLLSRVPATIGPQVDDERD